MKALTTRRVRVIREAFEDAALDHFLWSIVNGEEADSDAYTRAMARIVRIGPRSTTGLYGRAYRRETERLAAPSLPYPLRLGVRGD